MTPTARARLRDLLEHARRACPYWAGRLPPIEVALPDDVEALLYTLEPMSKAVLQHERARLLATTGDTADWRVARTTGTTGQPVEVVLDAPARAAESDGLARLFDRRLAAGWRAADSVYLVLHPGAASRVMPSPFHASALAVKWNLLRLWQQPDTVVLERLQRLDGTLVTTLPSVLALLAERVARAGGRGPRARAILVSGERVEPGVVDRAERVFGCPVTAAYILTEAGVAGTSCTEVGTYHVEDEAVHLEIVDGEIVVTPLANRALPLLRYRTGDRGAWCGPCACGNPAPRFTVEDGRQPARLVTSEGAGVNTVRFAKLLAGLAVDRIDLAQEGDGGVVVTYEAPGALATDDRMLVGAVLRGALGPETRVSFRWTPPAAGTGRAPSGDGTARVRRGPVDPRVGPDTPAGVRRIPGAGFETVETDGPGVAAVARWLGDRLAGEAALDAAVITGSALDVAATTRRSDVDAVLLVRDPHDPRWLRFARATCGQVARLTVNVDEARGLSRRSPVLACRLRAEQFPILGALDEALVPWPSGDDLRADARLRLQDRSAILWQRLTQPATPLDAVFDATLASRIALEALRCRQLVEGARQTAARAVLAAAAPAPWLAAVRDAWDVAREIVPPPPAAAAARWLEAALACVRDVQPRVA